MAQAARLGDAVTGTTAGEHSGHVPPHPPETFSGEISGGCSGDVFINGIPAAVAGSTTTERDGCCGSSREVWQWEAAAFSSTGSRRPAGATLWLRTAGPARSAPAAAM